MAVQSSGLDNRLGLAGLTVILAVVFLWLGTRKGSAILGQFPQSFTGSVAMTALVCFVAFWIGARNPSIFGALPIIGKATDG